MGLLQVGVAYGNSWLRFQLKPNPNSHPPPPARASETPATAPALAPAPAPAPAQAAAPAAAAAAASAPAPSSAPPTAALTLEEELQEAIRRAQVRGSGLGVSDRMGLGSQVHASSARPQLLPNRGIDDILEDQVEPEGKSRTPRFGGGD